MNNTVKFHAELEFLPEMLRWIRSQLRLYSIETSEKKKFEVASEEILVNIIHYAYEGEIGEIEMEWIEKSPFIHLTFKDSGKPFNPLSNQKAVIKSLSVDYKDIGGLGIFFAKNFVDKIEYHYKNNTNILTISKNIG